MSHARIALRINVNEATNLANLQPETLIQDNGVVHHHDFGTDAIIRLAVQRFVAELIINTVTQLEEEQAPVTTHPVLMDIDYGIAPMDIDTNVRSQGPGR